MRASETATHLFVVLLPSQIIQLKNEEEANYRALVLRTKLKRLEFCMRLFVLGVNQYMYRLKR